MKTNEILTANVLDIIFDGKNKSYGAYELRMTYNRRLIKAVSFTFVLMLVAILGIVLEGMAGKNRRPDFEVADVEIATIKPNETLPPVIPPQQKLIQPPVNQVKHTQPIIVKDDQVKDDEKIEEIHDDQVIGSKTIESDNKGAIIQAPVAEQGSSIVEAPKKDDEDIIFLKVENEAEFAGGQQAWIRYLKKNLNPSTASDNAAPPGTYQVIVKFIVSKDGTISDVVAESKHGYGMEEEAVKIIKRGPKWIPANQNGRSVNAYRRQPITFLVEEQ